MTENIKEFSNTRVFDIPVYVINLKRSVERRRNTVDQLEKLDVSYHIIEAVDGYDLTDHEIKYDKKYALWKMGSRTRHLFKGEIGCVLSHLKIYAKMIQENIEVACILEDDIILNGAFREFLNYENLKSLDWELFYLGHHSRFSKNEAWVYNKIKLKLTDYSAGEPMELPGGSYAYIIKKSAAMEILKHAYPIRKSLDHYLGNAPALSIRTLLLSPPCVNHDYLTETTIIQDSVIKYRRSFIEYFRIQLRKSYKWFPFLQTFRIAINLKMNLFLRYLRMKGFFRRSYARFD